MRRKVFDTLASAGGLLVVVMLVVAGSLAMWGYSFANSNVSNQLAEQQITFPPLAAFATAKPGTEITPQMIPYLEKYAGEPLLTGQQAEAYADHFIAYHLQEIGGGLTYAQVSAKAMSYPKGSPNYLKEEGIASTMFQGTTLRGLLLEAYAFWTFGQIALFAGIASFVLAGLMLVLVAIGFLHARRTPEDEELLVVHTQRAPGTPAAPGTPVATGTLVGAKS
jgi:Mn2+/Fe2+ NRAMP family transporter